MKKQLLSISAILILANMFVLFAVAQDKSKATVPHNLVLEINYFKGRPIARQTLPASGAKSGGAWYSLFRRIPDFQPSAGNLLVRAVNIIPQMEDETAKIRVSVFTGKKFHDKEEFVADYSIRENEKAVVKELTRFGVEPFEIAVVRIAPTVADLPTVISNFDSIKVLVEPNYSTLPTFKVSVLNNSNKAVSAFAFQTKAGNRMMISGMPQGNQSRPLIASGETYERILPNSLQESKNASAQDAETLPNLTLVILTVVFEDGSYEGNPQEAARFLAFSLGRKLLLERAVPVWRKASSDKSEISVLDKLIKQISGLSEEVDETAYAELTNKFPMLGEKEKNDLRISAQIALKGNKRDMIAEIQEMRKNQNAELPGVLLADAGQKYQDWLERLSK